MKKRITVLILISTLLSACSPSQNKWVGYFCGSEEIMTYDPADGSREPSGQICDSHLDLRSDNTFRLLYKYRDQEDLVWKISGVWFAESTNLFYAASNDGACQIGRLTGIPSPQGIENLDEKYGHMFRLKSMRRISKSEFPNDVSFPETDISLAALKRLIKSRPDIIPAGAESKSEFIESVRKAGQSKDLLALMELAYFGNRSDQQVAREEFYFSMASIAHEPILKMKEEEASYTERSLEYMTANSNRKYPYNCKSISSVVLNTRVFFFGEIDGRWYFVTSAQKQKGSIRLIRY